MISLAISQAYCPSLVQVEDRIAVCPIIERPRGTTPIIDVIALEQMGFKVDPVTGKLIKGLPLMLAQRIESTLYPTLIGDRSARPREEVPGI